MSPSPFSFAIIFRGSDMQASRYNFFTDAFFENQILAYNTLWGSFQVLSNEDWQEWDAALQGKSEVCEETREKMIAGGFLSDHDESAVLRARFSPSSKTQSQHGLSLTIAPTVNCNFRCTYCFQEHPKRRMSDEDITAIKSHVDENLKPKTSLHVMWFGGEPLMAFDVIEELATSFQKTCEERGATFHQSMVSNASLLDEAKIAFFEKMGNLGYIQVTLDGLPDSHDARRCEAGGRGTFQKILKNIDRAAGRVPITLRINIDKMNAGELESLVDHLVDYGLRDRVNMYLGQLLPYTEACDEVSSKALSGEEFAKREVQFQFYLIQRGFKAIQPLPRPRSGNLCVADHPSGAVLAPHGLAFKCWNETAMSAQQASGQYGDGLEMFPPTGLYADNRKRWDEYDLLEYKTCNTCHIQPLCMGGCPWEAQRTPGSEIGSCSSLKYVLADRLRIFHLQTALANAPLPNGLPGADDVHGVCVPGETGAGVG